MSRNLKLCFFILALVAVIPYALFEVGAATPKWSLFWQIRAYLVNYTGYIAMMLMSLTVILSVRHWPIESFLRGLDQQYRLHKYLGISSLVFALLHWLAFLSDDLVMDLGFIAETEERYSFWKLFSLLGEPAQLIGEWGFYIALILVVIASFRFFSFKVFQLTHQIFPYLYLLLVIHMIAFYELSYWLSLPGALLATVVFIAVAGCLIALRSGNGINKRSTALVEEITPINSGVLVRLKPKDQEAERIMKTYKPGQFVFASFDDEERGHPFSIASCSNEDGKVALLIKESGDYTNKLATRLEREQSVHIEGPYGRFDFCDKFSHQVWVAGGIGIAPFLSGLERLPDSKTIDLIYSYSREDQTIIRKLRDLTAPQNIRLHLFDTSKTPRLQCTEVLNKIQTMSDCSVWYCGPESFGEDLEKFLHDHGLPRRAFHRELFNFR